MEALTLNVLMMNEPSWQNLAFSAVLQDL